MSELYDSVLEHSFLLTCFKTRQGQETRPVRNDYSSRLNQSYVYSRGEIRKTLFPKAVLGAGGVSPPPCSLNLTVCFLGIHLSKIFKL